MLPVELTSTQWSLHAVCFTFKNDPFDQQRSLKRPVKRPTDVRVLRRRLCFNNIIDRSSCPARGSPLSSAELPSHHHVNIRNGVVRHTGGRNRLILITFSRRIITTVVEIRVGARKKPQHATAVRVRSFTCAGISVRLPTQRSTLVGSG